MSPLSAERRAHRRFPLGTTISFYHGPTQREFPGRCVDVSQGGMLMYVPVSAPVTAGQFVRVQVDDLEPEELTSLAKKPMECKIVRVNRSPMLQTGQVAIGLEFGADESSSR